VPENLFMDNVLDAIQNPVRLQELHSKQLQERGVRIFVLRVDELDNIISGNKLFKLWFYLKEAAESTHKTLITFGGFYSNHLVATAEAARSLQLRAVGFVRGERPRSLTHTLEHCISVGMDIRFISRRIYDQKVDDQFISHLKNEFGDFTLIPEGGASITGRRGAELIISKLNNERFTHACCAVGTATTLAGLHPLQGNGTKLIGFSVLKGESDMSKRLQLLLPNEEIDDIEIIIDFHFGGYAKKNKELLEFMNYFYHEHKIQTDFVYTAKMFYGVMDLVNKNYFPFNSKVLCLHSGGLQGNLSLPTGTLAF
jgi:1-aminocyclopropane-1-carboxylate deaminase